MKYIYDYQYKNTTEKKSKTKLTNLIRGGKLTGQKRQQYLDLCFSLKTPNEKYDKNVLDLINYLKEYIEPRVPEAKVDLFQRIFSIVDDPNKLLDIDTNLLSIINLMSLQCTILLTDYSEEAQSDPNYMLYIADPYNDPSNPESSSSNEDTFEEIDELYDISIKDLQQLTDEELDELTNTKIDEMKTNDEDLYNSLFEVYEIDNEEELKIILKKRAEKPNKKYNTNVFFTIAFNELLACDWTNYIELKNHIIKTPMLYNLFSTLIYSRQEKEYEFPLKQHENIFLAVILGEMTLSELLIASAKQIYFIGVVYSNTIADGYRYNPFLFFYHDIDHARGDINDRYMISDSNKLSALNKKIIRFIRQYNKKAVKNSIKKEKYNNIMFWLFLLAHEFPLTVGLLIQRGHDLMDTLNRLLKGVLFPFGSRYPYLFRFKNELDLGGLIPPQYRTNIYKIVESKIIPTSNNNNLMEDKHVPLFFKKSVIDFTEAWFPELKERARSLETKKKSKTRNIKTKKHYSI